MNLELFLLSPCRAVRWLLQYSPPVSDDPRQNGVPPATPVGERLWTRRQAIVALGATGLISAGSTIGLGGCASSTHGGQASPRARTGTKVTPNRPRSASTPPNVLFIVADDMRYDQLPFMPKVNSLLVKQGRTFTQGRCNVSLCQPSRVGFMTGQTSKHNGELKIFLATALKDHGNTLGWWMNRAGYRCGLFGKYLNAIDGYGINAPRGFASWREVLIRPGEESSTNPNFHVHVNKGIVKTDLYETNYLTGEVLDFIHEQEPFFALLSPTQPHAPFIPRADLADSFRDLKVNIVDEVDVSDKPPWIRDKPPLTPADLDQLRRDAIGSLQELTAVDDMVGDVVNGMSPEMLANTVIIFTSDNGVHRGEHRRLGAATKGGPYDVGLRVPLVVRGPGFAPGPDVNLASLAMQDITATILDVGGATAGLPNQDGVSLRDLADHPQRYRDRALLHETSLEGWEGLPGDGVTTGPDHPLGFRKLFRYPSVRSRKPPPYTYECYDLDTDPDELNNWSEALDRRSERHDLELLLESLLA